MGSVVNLRIERKRAKRLKAEQEAAVERLVHGRSRQAQNLDRARRDKDLRSLDQQRIETGEKQ